MARAVRSHDLAHELTFTTSRSGGPGGQHVNKVNTKVTLRFDVNRSRVLSQEQKAIIHKKFSSRISREGILVIHASEKRSQAGNRKAVLDKFDRLLSAAARKKKVRKPTGPTVASKRRRAEAKKRKSEKKASRRKVGLD